MGKLIKKPSAIIVDIDGTLAINTSGRSPYDWQRVKEDAVHEPVRDIVNIYYGSDLAGANVILVSGRDGSCEGLTKEWLEENWIGYDQLFMRPAGNQIFYHSGTGNR